MNAVRLPEVVKNHAAGHITDADCSVCTTVRARVWFNAVQLTG